MGSFYVAQAGLNSWAQAILWPELKWGLQTRLKTETFSEAHRRLPKHFTEIELCADSELWGDLLTQ
jgi:hypothetical protein